MKERGKLLNEYTTFLHNPLSKVWDKGNDFLYDLCKKYPYHKNIDEIIAKIWLIGRSYAAALERRKENKDSNDAFYVWAADKIRCFGFDKKINSLPKAEKLCNENISVICNAHLYITEKFYKITKLNKRSLASKYLHFHRSIVPIYDLRAKQGITRIFNKYKFLKKPPDEALFESHTSYKGDREYVKFIKKIYRFQKFLLRSNCKQYTVRDIDKFLIANTITKTDIDNLLLCKAERSQICQTEDF